MPRLDNSDPRVINLFGLEYNEEDPGRTDPVDICEPCYGRFFAGFEQTEHPPYDEQDPRYNCEYCGTVLFDIDD